MRKINLIIIVLFAILKLDIISAEEIYEEYQIGDIVIYNDIDFYVIKNSDSTDDYVTLLKAEPLKTSEMKSLIDSTEVVNLVGNDGEYLTIPYLSKETCVSGGDTSGCTTDYGKSTVKQIVDVWANATLTDVDLKKDELGYKTRLLTYDELYNNLGYNNADWHVSYWQANQEYTPSWVYNNAYSYWTMSAEDDSTFSMFRVFSNGSLFASSLGSSSEVVRPVINLRKKGNEKENNSTIKSSKLPIKEYKIGDVVEYNGVKFYVIKYSSEKDNSVTLLKETPLTVDEVNKYGKDHINRYITNDTTASYYRQAGNQNGYGSISYLSTIDCGYTKTGSDSDTSVVTSFVSSGCTSEYTKSDFKYVIDNWVKDTFNSNDLIEDSLGYKARLITLDELMNNLNYVIDDQGNYVRSEKTPSWVYNDKYTYLTMTPSDDSNDTIISVKANGNLSVSGYYRVTWWSDSYDGVVRPVVTLKKNYNVENNQVVSVPDTFLKQPIIWAMIGIVFIVIGIILGYAITRKKKNTKGK